MWEWRNSPKNAAEKAYRVPHRTTSRHLKDLVAKPGHLGRFSSVLGIQFETVLVNHAIALQQRMFGLTTVVLRKLAFDIAEAMKLSHPFKNQKAGKVWLCSFLHRHNELAIHSPEATSIGRVVGFNRSSMNRFFRGLPSSAAKMCIWCQQDFQYRRNRNDSCYHPTKVIAK